MNDFIKTLSFIVVALALTGASFVINRERPIKDRQFDDQGQPFFPEFKDPLACTNLEVVSYDPTTASSARFQVMLKDKKWVIPSHYDYPADARDRLSKTAGAVMDLTRDIICSDKVEDQKAMGVLDPTDAKAATPEGMGKRVTLKDSSEKVLADFIIGNEIKGPVAGKEGKTQRYVRVPGQKRTYGVVVNADLSTKFADWIETNLLKVETNKIKKVVFDNYKMREARSEEGRPIVVPERGDRVTVTRKEGFGPWTATLEKSNPRTGEWTAAPLPANQEVNEDRLRSLVDALGDLKIVGVRPKPPGLTDPNDPKLQLTVPIVVSLQNRGFYLSPGHGLFSDQGDVIVTTDEGVVYTLRYGGPVYATGDELSAGTADTTEKKKDEAAGGKKDAVPKPKGVQENRYLLVTVSFDPTIIPQPKEEKDEEEAAPDPSRELPDDVFAHETRTAEQKKAAEERARSARQDYEKKLADGQKRVKDLAGRFGPWYYVTPGDSFNQINLDVNAVLRPKAPPGAQPGGMPGGFPGGGMPGGFPGGGMPGGFPGRAPGR